MARVEISEVVWERDATGNGRRLLVGAGFEVEVNDRDGGAATVYQDATGGATHSQPLAADSGGRIDGWVEEGSYDLIVNGDDANPQRYEAVNGGRTAVTNEAPLNVDWPEYAGDIAAAVAALPSTGARMYVPSSPTPRAGGIDITGKNRLTVFGDGEGSVIHNTVAGDDAIAFFDCLRPTLQDVAVQGVAGTRDGARFERCQAARAIRPICAGTGRYGVYAEESVGILVDSPVATVPDGSDPLHADIVPMQSGVVLGWDGVNADSGCNQFELRNAFSVVGKTQDWAIQILHAEGGHFAGIPELSKGGILIDASQLILGLGDYGEANPSDVEYSTGTCSVTNGSSTVTGSGTAWNTNDPQGNKNAMVGKYLVVGTTWARIQSIDSDTQITLAETWPGTTQAGVAYRMTGVDLLMKNSKDCFLMGLRGGGAILLEGSGGNFLQGICEQVLCDSGSNDNELRLTTNRASAAAANTRFVNAGARNWIRQINHQTRALVRDDTARLGASQSWTGINTFLGTSPTTTVILAADDGDAASRLAIRANGSYEVGDGTAARDTTLARAAAAIWGVTNAFQFPERADPSAPSANNVILYCKDNGSGKTQLAARFPTGAVQVIATEP